LNLQHGQLHTMGLQNVSSHCGMLGLSPQSGKIESGHTCIKWVFKGYFPPLDVNIFSSESKDWV